jgi:hypothetical protein
MPKDNERNIHELKAKIKEFCDKRDWDQFHNAKELAIALSIEASELLEIFRYTGSKPAGVRNLDYNRKCKRNYFTGVCSPKVWIPRQYDYAPVAACIHCLDRIYVL